MVLSELVGTWAGTNGFRLMPGDALREFPASATVTAAAGGHLTLVTYVWEHPDDGPQDGVLLIESTGDAVTATWGDSRHQKPETLSLSGGGTDSTVSVEATYAGDWGWRILLANEAGALRLRMDNVIPAGYATEEKAAGPYPVMLMEARRA